MSEGYWRNTAIAIVTCLQLASGTVLAAEKTYTAKDLLQDCRDSLLERAPFPRPFYSGLCIGLVAGANYVDAKSCAPEDATNSELGRVLINRLGDPADVLIPQQWAQKQTFKYRHSGRRAS